MIRVLLPLAVVAAILLGPLTTVTSTDSEFGKQTRAVAGLEYVKPTIDCWQKGEYSLEDKCEPLPKGEIKGKLLFAAVATSALAAVFGVLGLLPMVGRVTSFVTVAAGGVVMAAMGYYAMTQLGNDGGGLQWGTYLAAGGGLLTLISGLAGVRGR